MGRIDNTGNFYFSSATTRFSYFGIFWGDFVVCSRGDQGDVRMWLIKINLDRKKNGFLTTRASTTKFAPRLNPHDTKNFCLASELGSRKSALHLYRYLYKTT